MTWWERYKKRKTIDHRSGTIDGSSLAYDEMWDFIKEEIVPELQDEFIEWLKEAYGDVGHNDDWGVRVVYLDSLIDCIKEKFSCGGTAERMSVKS